MLDYVSFYFLTLVSHCLLFVLVLWEPEGYAVAGLPIEDWLNTKYDMKISITVCVILSLSLVLAEIFLLVFQLPTIGKVLFSASIHFFAVVLLCKFIIDTHPVHHFWIAFPFTCIVAIAPQLIVVLSKFRIHDVL